MPWFCVVDISKWMHENKLKLNDIKPSSSAHNLRATFEQNMTLKPHISSPVKSCYWQLQKIGHLRKYLTKDAADKLIQAFISSRLDNGNGLLYSFPDYQIKLEG